MRGDLWLKIMLMLVCAGFSLLGYHREKLAVAFGIISTPPETIIKLLTIEEIV